VFLTGGASTNSSTARLLRGNSTPDFDSMYRTAEMTSTKKKSKSTRRLGKILKEGGLETMQGLIEVFDNDETEDDQSVGGNSCASIPHLHTEVEIPHGEQDPDYMLFCQAINELVRIKSPVTHPSRIELSSIGGPPVPKGGDLESLMESLNKAEGKAWEATLITPQDRSPSATWAPTSTLSASHLSLASETSVKLRPVTERDSDDVITLSTPSGKRSDILEAQKFESEIKDTHRQSKSNAVEGILMNAMGTTLSPAICHSSSSSSSRSHKHLPAITDTVKAMDGMRTLDLGSDSVDEGGNIALCDASRLTPMRSGSKSFLAPGSTIRTFTASARMEEIMPSTDCTSQSPELGSSTENHGPDIERDISTPVGTRKKGKRHKKGSLKIKTEPGAITEEKIEKKSKKVVLLGIEHEKEKEKDFLGKKNHKESSKTLSKIDVFEDEKAVTVVNSLDDCYQADSRKESEDFTREATKELSDKDDISKDRSLDKEISLKVPGKKKKSNPGKLAGSFVTSVKSAMEKIVEKRERV
jgi:hypothetical protein